jgi:hypothetical protein
MKQCLICDEKHYGLGYCVRHYYIFKTYKDPHTKIEVKRDRHTSHPLYITWINMHKRCYNPYPQDKPFYFDRGIKVCDRWHGYQGFKNFIKDMSDKPSNTSLDRIDNSKDYSPDNCRWASAHSQSRNTRRSKLNTSGGITGVSFVKHRNTWDARIMINRKVILLGTYGMKDEAVKARQEAEKEYGIIY